MTRQQLQKIIHFLLFTLTHVEYVGVEHIPQHGPLMIVTNHLSRIDIPVLLENPVRPEITALVATKYKEKPFFRWILDTAGVIYLDRDAADFKAFREAKRVLKEGVALGIAPEGTRSKTGSLAEGKSGAAMLAMQLQIPVVPVGISGTEATFTSLARLKRPHILARFGKAFHLPPLDGTNREAQLQRGTDEIMCRIAAMLPEQYHGYYAGHPRLVELSAENSV
jgi:1-acyl-sn-glycerol-3-phosphate acyltransferase